MKRITIVTDAWPPQVNGVVVTLRNMLTILEKDGYEVSIIHPYLFSFRFPLPTYPEILLAPCRPGRMKKMIEETRPDHVHIVTEGTLGFAARIACRRYGYAFTTAYHTNFPLYVSLRIPGAAKVVYALLRWFHRAASAVLVPTVSMIRNLEEHGFSNLILWPQGVDATLFKPLARPASEKREPCFVYFGRISVEKNIEEFLELSLPGSKLVIGDGPDRARLERTYGSSATFVGYKLGQALVDALSQADVAVCPSRSETFGLTIVEALACGIPVAAHDATGPRDIITPGVDGILDEDLARAALACLPLSKEACRHKALQYSWGRSVEVFLNNLVPARI